MSKEKAKKNIRPNYKSTVQAADDPSDISVGDKRWTTYLFSPSLSGHYIFWDDICPHCDCDTQSTLLTFNHWMSSHNLSSSPSLSVSFCDVTSTWFNPLKLNLSCVSQVFCYGFLNICNLPKSWTICQLKEFQNSNSYTLARGRWRWTLQRWRQLWNAWFPPLGSTCSDSSALLTSTVASSVTTARKQHLSHI